FSFRKGANPLVRSHAIDDFEDGIMHRLLEHEPGVDRIVCARCKNSLVDASDERHGQYGTFSPYLSLPHAITNQPQQTRQAKKRATPAKEKPKRIALHERPYAE